MSENDALESRIVGTIKETRTALNWDELRDEFGVDDDRLDDALTELQDEGRIRYSGRKAGYWLSDIPTNDTCAICGGHIETGEHRRVSVSPRGPTDAKSQSYTMHVRCQEAVTSGWGLS
jgi:hypothetical protein